MCMYDGCDDYPTVYKHAQHTARKTHKCVECARDILPGERYHYDFQVYDGWASTYHTCAHCRVAQDWLVRECGGYLIEGTWQDIEEHIGEYQSLRMPLGRLMVGYRRKWRKRSGQLFTIPTIPSASAEQYIS